MLLERLIVLFRRLDYYEYYKMYVTTSYDCRHFQSIQYIWNSSCETVVSVQTQIHQLYNHKL